MALKYKLEEMAQFKPQLRFMNGSHITYDSLANVLKEGADAFGIPMAYYMDEVKSGGLLKKRTEDCLVIYNPEHKNDYYNFCIKLSKMGNVAFLDTYIFGSSRLASSRAAGKSITGEDGSDGLGFFKGVLGKVVHGGYSQADADMEDNYYTLISDIFDTLETVQYDGLKTGFFGTT